MDIRKLQRTIVDGLEDVKAQNIAVFNTEHLSALFERVIIASGTSNRQTKALAASVRDAVRAKGFPVMRTEGEDNGEWIIVDCGAAVVHVMQPSIREYYHLEEIWGEKPVRLKLGAAAPKLVKAEEPAAARRAAARRTVAAPGGDGSAAKKAGAKASRSAAGRAADAPKRNAVPRTVGAQRPAPAAGAPAQKARKASARKTSARQTIARKTPVRKAATRTVGTRKSAAAKAGRSG